MKGYPKEGMGVGGSIV